MDHIVRNNCLHVISWNVNSWTVDNKIPRELCRPIKKLNPDIVFVIETKLKYGQELVLNEYTWYGLNRRKQLRTAKCGSGGVGMFIKNTILRDWEFQELDREVDGLYLVSLVIRILILKLFYVHVTYPQITVHGPWIVIYILIILCHVFIL